MTNQSKVLDQIKGALYGLAIGDALGAATEFMTPEQIEQKYGFLTEMTARAPWKKGETTDDTAMTMALARGLLDDPDDPIPNIGERFLQWNDTEPKDVGNIIQSVFKAFRGDWLAASEEAHKMLGGKSAGNGSLMRCLPIALAYNDVETISWFSRLQSKMTHFDDEAAKACIIYNQIAFQLLQGEALKPAILSVIEGTAYESAAEARPAGKPDGYVVNTLEWVLWILLNRDSYADVVQTAANLGYDSDTVAAIAGGLAGLACGFDALPEQYVTALLISDELDDISLRLRELRRKLADGAKA